MQFDDRLSTLLADEPRSPASRDARWSQLVDLLAQGAGGDDRDQVESTAQEWGVAVAPARRLATAKAIGPRIRSVDLVRIFGADEARIAAPVLLGAKLSGKQWREVIPMLPPHARNLLRQRRDLPGEAREALQSFGHSDFAIAAPIGDASLSSTENTQIRDLMARIADWREQRPLGAATPPAVEPAVDTRFRLETSSDGLIVWTDAPDRAMLIGLSLAEPAAPDSAGFAPKALTAFTARVPFRQARLTLPDRSVWTTSGDPVFDTNYGALLGYRCVARSLGDGDSRDAGADAFRHLAHELRTPLNAVQGFAEMMEAQLLGPLGQSYRQRATAIGLDVADILAVLRETESRIAD